MKKILSLLLILILSLSVLVACGEKDTTNYDIDAAAEFLNAYYKNLLPTTSNPTPTTPNSFTVVRVLSTRDGKYAISWTTNSDVVTVVDFEGTEVGYTNEIAATVKVPSGLTADVAYKLIATITAPDGKTTKTVEFNLVAPGVSAELILDLTSDANLVSASAEKNVFAANGITFINEKASSTSDLVVKDSFAQRAYKGSTVRIEYPGMTKIVITLDDYVQSGKTYMAGFDGMIVEGATITRDNDILTIVFSAPTDVFQSTPLASQTRIEKIQVFTGEVEGGNGGNGGNEGDNQGGNQGGTTPAYTAPVAGQPYNFFMELPSGKVYFAGSISGNYLATTTDASAAVAIYFEEVAGGYHIYFMDGETKTYITAAAYLKDNGYAGCHFSLTTETPTLAWTYNTTYGIIEIYDEISGKSDTFFAGTYGTYSTFSLSGQYYRDQIASGTQYPGRIEATDGEIIPPSQGGDETHTHTFVDGKCSCGEQDPNYVPPSEGGDVEDGMMTIPEVLDSAEGTAVVVKGTVHSFYYDWNEQYGNCSVYIVDDAGNKLLCFRLKTKVYVGDQITVTGSATIYSGTVQVAEGCTATIDVAHTCNYTVADCGNDSVCKSCGAAGADKATGNHTYVDGVCTVCGASTLSMKELGTLSFSSTANRTTFTSSQQVWAANGITVTNNKGASTSNVADYSNPARFYKSSQLIVSATGMLKIVFTCDSTSYATAFESSLPSGTTVSVNGNVVTVTFAKAVDSFEIPSLTGGQVRMDSITVYVAE